MEYTIKIMNNLTGLISELHVDGVDSLKAALISHKGHFYKVYAYGCTVSYSAEYIRKLIKA